MNLLLVQNGNSLSLMRADQSAFDLGWVEAIKDLLSFTYKVRQKDGKVSEETRYMCQESEDRTAIYLSSGLRERLVSFLKDGGHTVWLQTTTDPSRRYSKLFPVLDSITEDKFRPRQKECFDAILNNPNGVIQAPTGFGKTYLLGLL